MSRRFIKRKKNIKKTARQRIKSLVNLAVSVYPKDPDLSVRYVSLARNISMKTRTKTPSEVKKKFCKNCLNPFIPGLTCRVRLKGNNIVYYCKGCKHFKRFRYK
ncbi:MAG: ribonuclease P protein component 4 [Nanobdellota archaeon]